MIDATAVILTRDEEVHIGRCLEKLRGVARRVVVVDSGSTDRTREIARSMGAEVVEHEWEGNQADQFNWALDGGVSIDTEWILRLDADEYLGEELKRELDAMVPALGADVAAVALRRGRYFMGKELRHGANVVEIVRLWRRGHGRYEHRLMDEHVVLRGGEVAVARGLFFDDNRMPLGEFVRKHEGYASREAALLLDEEMGLTSAREELAGGHGDGVERKRAQKRWYGRLPLQWRALAYFLYRYVARGGFLNGREGFVWDFMQGWWYRSLVDAKLAEVKRECGDDRVKTIRFLRDVYGVRL